MGRTMKLITLSTLFLLVTWALPAANSVTAQGQQQEQDRQERQAPTQAPRIDLDQLMGTPSHYVGREVTIQGTVDDVLGPRLFTLGEGRWLDLFDEEALVYVQDPNVAMLREREDVEVTGTVRMYSDVQRDVTGEWGWLQLDADYAAELNARPVIVAESVKSQNGDELIGDGAMARPARGGVRPDPTTPADPADPARGTMGQPITDTAEVAGTRGTREVGRAVKLDEVTIASAAEKGFWVELNGDRLYVLPGTADESLQAGDTVTIEGTVLAMPSNMSRQIGDDLRDEDVYVFAKTITKR